MLGPLASEWQQNPDHQLNGHEFEQTPRVGDGQGIWPAAVHGVTKSDTIERQN